MRNIIYCRVSSLKPTSFSFINQEEECTKYCKLNHLRIHQVQKEHISGFGKQKSLEQLILKNKNVNLIIYNVSRFSRHQLFGLDLLKRCNKNNINIHFVKENIKFIAKEDVDGNKILKELGSSEEEWHTIRNTTIKSITSRRKKGMVLGNVPFGFDNVNKKLVTNNDFNAIRFIIGLRNGVKTTVEMKEILKKLSPNYNTLQYCDVDGNVISKFDNTFTLSFKDIAIILNEYNICGKRWIKSRVKYLYDKYCNDNEFKEDTSSANLDNITNILNNLK